MTKYIMLLILSIMLTACGTSTQGEATTTSGTTQEDASESNNSGPYIAAFEHLMEEDPGLNGDMEFIAIDMSNLEVLSEADQKAIISHFEKIYDIEVKIATFDELKEQGHFNEETMVLDGVLLSINSFNQESDKKFVFEGEKYRSGLGAIGLKMTVSKTDQKWEVTESQMLWIS